MPTPPPPIVFPEKIIRAIAKYRAGICEITGKNLFSDASLFFQIGNKEAGKSFLSAAYNQYLAWKALQDY